MGEVQALSNPYTPNAGAEPLAVVGRDEQLDWFEILLARIERGRTEQSMIVTGLRGVGKTVLLGQFRSRALERNWVVMDLEASKHDDQGFRRSIASRVRTALFELSPKARWGERLRHAAGVLSSFTLSLDSTGKISAGVDVEAAEGFADHQDLALDLSDLLVALAEAARDRKRGVVLLLDELQFLSRSQLEAVIQALHKIVQRKLPFTMVGAGLPQMAELAGDAKSYAERLFTFPAIGDLDEEDARAALTRPAAEEGVSFEEEALDEAMRITGGYPYFLQELGYAVWTVAEGPVVTVEDVRQAVLGYEAKLDESFFRVRLDRTTPLQRAYLRAMAELGGEPQRAGDVATVLDRTSQNLGPTRAELINMGLLYTPQHGYAAFTVPHFDRYLRRVIPELVRIEPRRRKKS